MLRTPMMHARPWLALLVALPLVGLGGCASKRTHAGDAAPPAAASADSVGDADAAARDLDQYEAQLRAVGVLGGGADDDANGGANEASSEEAPEAEPAYGVRPTDRCSRICDLADAICELEDRICDLSRRNVEDAAYARVCERAAADCELASSACRECNDG